LYSLKNNSKWGNYEKKAGCSNILPVFGLNHVLLQ
jgi:hypothetical protein